MSDMGRSCDLTGLRNPAVAGSRGQSVCSAQAFEGSSRRVIRCVAVDNPGDGDRRLPEEFGDGLDMHAGPRHGTAGKDAACVPRRVACRAFSARFEWFAGCCADRPGCPARREEQAVVRPLVAGGGPQRHGLRRQHRKHRQHRHRHQHRHHRRQRHYRGAMRPEPATRPAYGTKSAEPSLCSAIGASGAKSRSASALRWLRRVQLTAR